MLHIVGKRGKGVTILDTSSWKEETVNVNTLEQMRATGVQILENVPIVTPEALKLKTLGLVEIVLNEGGYLEEIHGTAGVQFNLSDVCSGLSITRNVFKDIKVVGEWYLYIDDRFKVNGTLPDISKDFDINAKLILDLSKCTPRGALRIISNSIPSNGILFVNAPVDEDVYRGYLLDYFENAYISMVLPYFQTAFKPLIGRFLSDYLDKILSACDDIKAYRGEVFKRYDRANNVDKWSVWRERF